MDNVVVPIKRSVEPLDLAPFLQENLPAQVFHFKDADREFFLVGTAHVSPESVRDVFKTIELVKPDTILIELCSDRRMILSDDASAQFKASKEMSFAEILEKMKTDRTSALQLCLGKFYKKVGDQLDVFPGEEFRAAANAGQALGCRVLFGDRRASITLARAWAKLSTFRRLHLLAYFVYSLIVVDLFGVKKEDIEKLKSADALDEMLEELGSSFPQLFQVLKIERDLVMAYKLRHCQGQRIVGVYGLGHIKGIMDSFYEDINIAELESVPSAAVPRKSVIGRMVKTVAILGVISFFVYKRLRHNAA
eukprot:GILK01004024.1.p1 GENE.GILK01004024.1~~GILK01004024.1.p1  ORF type:complete len:319 (-),score=47.60 GILK01004024.1:20-940(-)